MFLGPQKTPEVSGVFRLLFNAHNRIISVRVNFNAVRVMGKTGKLPVKGL